MSFFLILLGHLDILCFIRTTYLTSSQFILVDLILHEMNGCEVTQFSLLWPFTTHL